MKHRRRVRRYGFIAIAFLAFLGVLVLCLSIFGIDLLGTEDRPVGRVEAPATPDSAEQLERAAEVEAAYVARARQAAAEQAREQAAAERAVVAERRASERRAEDKPAPTVPADTTMYLTIPRSGSTTSRSWRGHPRRFCRRASATCPARASRGWTARTPT